MAVVAAVLCAAGIAIAPQASDAARLQVPPSRYLEMRDGVLTERVMPADKVSSPDLPTQSFWSTSFTVSSNGVDPGAGETSFAQGVTASIEADPGDAPDAALCVSYRLTATVAGSVISPAGSFAMAFAGQAGATSDDSSAPASVTAPSPATMIVTPLVGPVRTIFSVAPMIVSGAAGSATNSLSQSDRFVVNAGDIIAFQSILIGAVRGEVPSGSANINGQASLSLTEGCPPPPPVPGLSRPGIVLLALLLSAVTLGRLRLRRTG